MGVSIISKPTYIEFIGLPGAGKTTIAQELINQVTLSGERCFGLSTIDKPEDVQKNKGGVFSKIKSLYHLLNAIFYYPDIAYYSLLYSFHVKPFRLVNLNRGLILLVRLNNMKTFLFGDHDFIVLDQNLIQNVWSIGAASNTPTENKYFEKLLTSIFNKTLPYIIYVDINVDITIERIKNRKSNRSRFDTMPLDKIKELLNAHKLFFDQTINIAEENENINHIKISGDQPINKNVELIVASINQLNRSKKNLPY